MKPAVIATLLALMCSSALAVDHSAKAWPSERQKPRMPECTARASGLSGTERTVFMSKCLKGEDTKPAPRAEPKK